jgi:hypothetical protein
MWRGLIWRQCFHQLKQKDRREQAVWELSESDREGRIDNDAVFFHELRSGRGSWAGGAATGDDW